MLKSLHQKSLKRFPPGDVVAREWRLGVEAVAPMPGGHGQQALVRLGGGRAVVLKRLRLELLAPTKAEAILGAVAAIAREEGVDVAAPLPRRGEREFLLEWNGRLFYVMRFVDGVRPSFKRVEDVAAVMRALGKLHRAGEKIWSGGRRPAGWPAAEDLGAQFHKTFDTRYENWLGLMSGPAAGLGMRLAVRGVERAAAQAEEARARAPRAGDRKAIVPTVLRHGDTHENNFLVLESRMEGGAAHAAEGGEPLHRVAHLDVESFQVGAAVEDLVVPLHYLGYFSRWRPAALGQALAAYESERALGPAERAFLEAHLLLPRHWLRAMKSVLKKGAGLRDVKGWLKRRRSLRDIGRQRACVAELFDE